MLCIESCIRTLTQRRKLRYVCIMYVSRAHMSFHVNIKIKCIQIPLLTVCVYVYMYVRACACMLHLYVRIICANVIVCVFVCICMSVCASVYNVWIVLYGTRHWWAESVL